MQFNFDYKYVLFNKIIHQRWSFVSLFLLVVFSLMTLDCEGVTIR